MAKVLYFSQKPQLRKYCIQGVNLEIETNKSSFPPSVTSLSLAEHMKINSGETVIDVGVGSGILAILAAKLGGVVSATDLYEDVVETAKKNAKRNGVKIDFSVGEYFANFDKKFDVIVTNLGQEIIPKDYLKAIGRKMAKSIYGGPKGNKQILKFLDVAKNHMHKNSRAYAIIYTLSDYVPSMEKMLANYNARLVTFHSLPTREYVKDNLDMYLKLNKAGKIKIFQQGKKWMTCEYIFELALK